MRVVVIGAGEVGYHIAAKLAQEKADVVLIDKDRGRLEEVADQLDVQVVEGNGADPAVLREAQLTQADLLVAVSNSDESNILACRLAQLLAPQAKCLARIHAQGYYSELNETMLKEGLGVDFIINPTHEGVISIVDFLEAPGASDIIDVARGRLKLVGVRIPKAHPLVGQTLAQCLPRSQGHSILVAAIYRHRDLVIPRGDTVIEASDLLYMVATADDIFKINEFCGLSTKPPKNIFIAGGGEVGFYLAKYLEEHRPHMNIKLVENDPVRAEFLGGALNKTMVLRGDATDQVLLSEEGVADCDAFVAVTKDDEKNVISCLLAKRLGAAHTITRVNRFAYAPLVSAIGLESLVSGRVAAISSILKYIRKGKVVSVATLKSEDAEIIELEVSAKAKVVGMTFIEAPFPQGAMVAALTRDGNILIPRGDTVIKAKDILVVVAKFEVIHKVEKLLT